MNSIIPRPDRVQTLNNLWADPSSRFSRLPKDINVYVFNNFVEQQLTPILTKDQFSILSPVEQTTYTKDRHEKLLKLFNESLASCSYICAEFDKVTILDPEMDTFLTP